MFDLTIKDYTIAAGGRLKLDIPSDFFQVMEATDPVNIDFLKSHARVGYAEGVGQGFRLGPVSEPFHGIDIYSATAQTLKLCFSRGNTPVDLSQVVSVTGTVSVINGELTRVKSGDAFAQSGFQAAVAGQYSYVQLFNPAGAVKNVFLNRVTVMPSVASIISFREYDTALNATPYAYGLSKSLGGAASIAAIYNNSNASILGTESLMLVGIDTANKSGEVPFSEPLMLAPGKGVIAFANTVNCGFWASFQWIEEPV